MIISQSLFCVIIIYSLQAGEVQVNKIYSYFLKLRILKKFLIILPLLFLSLLYFYWYISSNGIEPNMIHLKVGVESGNNSQLITNWFNEKDNTYYIFLPSYSNINRLKVFTEESQMEIDGITYKNGDYLQNIQLDKKYRIFMHNQEVVSKKL